MLMLNGSFTGKRAKASTSWRPLSDIMDYAGCDGVDSLVWEVASEVWNNGPISEEFSAKAALRDLKRLFDDVAHGSIPAR